jgi:hypothetical protein
VRADHPVSDRVLVRLVSDHADLGEDGYHRWITFGQRVKANRLGIANPRMYDAEWTKWVCNNGNCPAWALVHDDAVIEHLLPALPFDSAIKDA